MAANMFEKAKKTTKTTTAKASDKLMVKVEGTEFDESLKTFATIKAKIDSLTAEMAAAQAVVKETGIKEFSKLYSENKRNVGSFIMTNEDADASVMFLPTKRYLKIDEDNANELRETYGEEVVTEDTKYSFNTAVLMRNMDVISEILMGSDKISDKDKENLLEAKTTFAVEKETLDKVILMKDKVEGEDDVEKVSIVLEDIQPVYQLKNAKLNS